MYTYASVHMIVFIQELSDHSAGEDGESKPSAPEEEEADKTVESETKKPFKQAWETVEPKKCSNTSKFNPVKHNFELFSKGPACGAADFWPHWKSGQMVALWNTGKTHGTFSTGTSIIKYNQEYGSAKTDKPGHDSEGEPKQTQETGW